MDLFLLTWSFILGVATLFSPCSLFIIPAYIGYYLGSLEASARRAILGTLMSVIGLLMVFVGFSIVIMFISEVIKDYSIYISLLAGIILIIMGAMILAKFTFPAFQPPIDLSSKRGMIGLFVFGIAYGLSASGCSLPLLLSVILISLAEGSFGSFLIMLMYGLGISLPLIGISILIIQLGHEIMRKMKIYSNKIYIISGILLIMAGLYAIYIYITLITL